MSTLPNERIRAQIALVEKHVRRENAHDLPGIMETFGDRAYYDDEAWSKHHEGRGAVHAYYADLLASLPDLQLEINNCIAAENGVVIEVHISGTHGALGAGCQPPGARYRSRSAAYSNSMMPAN
jgi:steroid delta-isomerase-like uncharacterized protein